MSGIDDSMNPIFHRLPPDIIKVDPAAQIELKSGTLYDHQGIANNAIVQALNGIHAELGSVRFLLEKLEKLAKAAITVSVADIQRGTKE